MHGSVMSDELARLKKRVERERIARLQAEKIAEDGLRDLYLKNEQIKLLQKVAGAANQTSNVFEAIQYALDEICSLMGWTAGHAYLVENDSLGPILVTTDLWSICAADASKLKNASANLSFRPGEGLPGSVYATGAAASAIDIAQSGNFPRATAALACGLHSAFAFPVLAGSEVCAVLEFFARTTEDVDPSFLGVMEQIGVQLGRVVERRRTEERLMYQASHDPLTGLANRALFLDRLERAASRGDHEAAFNYAVLFIDLDRFKLVNDSLGHAAGDRLIVETASRLLLLAGNQPRPDRVTVARLGGDEFTILIDDVDGPAEAMRLAQSVRKVVSAKINIDDQPVYMGASVGIALSGPARRSAGEILRDADIAMYRAKNEGRDAVVLFDRSMHEAAVTRLKLENDLRRALRQNEFVLHFQPIISLKSSRLVGFEALIRWQREGSLVMPAEFIPVAEETGLIIYIGEWVLQKAVETASIWCEQSPDLTISVNISPRHFAQDNFVSRVREIVSAGRVRPDVIRLELTEGVTVVDAERTAAVLKELRQFGVRISIDDFGTGYSSLSYLQKLPVDLLKIDRCFVSEMSKDEQSRKIVHTIMSLASSLGIEVVAEGAETASQVLDLVAMGCQYGQGYYFSRPVEADRALALLVANIEGDTVAAA